MMSADFLVTGTLPFDAAPTANNGEVPDALNDTATIPDAPMPDKTPAEILGLTYALDAVREVDAWRVSLGDRDPVPQAIRFTNASRADCGSPPLSASEYEALVLEGRLGSMVAFSQGDDAPMPPAPVISRWEREEYEVCRLSLRYGHEWERTRPIEVVLGSLQGVRELRSPPAHYKAHCEALCPAHADRKPSLYVAEHHDGGVHVHCRAGCTKAAIVTAIDLKPRDLHSRITWRVPQHQDPHREPPDSPPKKEAPGSAGAESEAGATGSREERSTTGDPEDFSAPDKRPRGQSPAEVVGRWANEGPLVRVPTGIAPLDDLCRGGFPIPWRVMIVGAPSAGKTFLQVVIANTLASRAAEAGLCVGILAADEDPDDVTIRLAQLAGFSLAEAEKRDPDVLAEMAEALRDVRVRLYDGSQTIEDTADDLHAWAQKENRQAALFIDSLHTVRARSSANALSGRDLVEMNCGAMRYAAEKLRMLVVATTEANRAFYGNLRAERNDIAAGAESRAIEYVAQTQLTLRTPKDEPDIVHVTIPKNRRATRNAEFFLRIDRDEHTLTPVARAPDAPTDAQSGTPVEKVRELVRSAPGKYSSANQICKALGCSRPRILTAVRQLLDAKQISPDEQGNYFLTNTDSYDF